MVVLFRAFSLACSQQVLVTIHACLVLMGAWVVHASDDHTLYNSIFTSGWHKIEAIVRLCPESIAPPTLGGGH